MHLRSLTPLSNAQLSLYAEVEHRPVVCDCGSGNVKAGLAGEDAPSAVFSNIVGRPKFKEAMVRVPHARALTLHGRPPLNQHNFVLLSIPV